MLKKELELVMVKEREEKSLQGGFLRASFADTKIDSHYNPRKSLEKL